MGRTHSSRLFRSSSEEPPVSSSVTREPIAIIGMGCRFPGSVRSPESFWKLLKDGRDAISVVPPSRFDIDALYDSRPSMPGKLITRWGGFLDDIDQFDPYFFGISPREAAQMDPQHRLLLEVSWEAIEDAGENATQLNGSQTGVFIGMITNDYADFQFHTPQNIDIYASTGGFRSMASGRISFALGLRGPSMTIDTACSSSLVAVHLACQSIWNGESILALAGGANLILHPGPSLGFSQAGMLAKDGRCKFGDSRADGFVRSEGIAIVVLKSLSQAIADNNPIHALILGSATNNDGQGTGIMTPNVAGQKAVLRQAYRSAGIAPSQVQYVEAHGTGTNVGDPTELKALGAILGEGRPSDQPCIVGSVKTNIGHTEGAAGMAGLFKVVLSLKQRSIPASLHIQQLNPDIPWDSLPLQAQQTTGPWPDYAETRLAGVSSFGISGTNAHAVIQEAPDISLEHRLERRTHLLALSAHTLPALQAKAKSYQSLNLPLADLCYTANARRAHFPHRLSCVLASTEELDEQLNLFLESRTHSQLASGRSLASEPPKVAFVFPGQGSQWFGMGRELLEEEPIFRATIEACEEAIKAHTDWSLIEVLTKEDQSWLEQIDVIQPMLFATQVALAALWRFWGIEPDIVVGHSMGEVAAAYVAGALTLPDACAVICRRSRLLRKISGQGAMLAVDFSIEQATEALHGWEDQVAVAVSNSPVATVLSGDAEALAQIASTLQERGIIGRWIKVDVASHSPQVDVLRDELLHVLADVKPQTADIPIYSTVTGEISDGSSFDASYWVNNLRQPVLFGPVVQQLIADDYHTFIEISPHPILLSSVRQGLHHKQVEGHTIASLQRQKPESVTLLASLGQLYTLGFNPSWDALYPHEQHRPLSLPTYPWQHDRFWLQTDLEHTIGPSWLIGGPRHPLLHRHLALSQPDNQHVWESDLTIRHLPYLSDHRVEGTIILPGTAHMEMIFSAAQQVLDVETCHLAAMELKTALILPEEEARTVQLILSPQAQGKATFQLFSRHADTWTLHSAGFLNPHQNEPALSTLDEDRRNSICQRCSHEMSGLDFYRQFNRQGNQWGPHFQAIQQLWRRDGEALAFLEAPPQILPDLSHYQAHPALLDACAQVIGAAAPWRDDVSAFMPSHIESISLWGPLSHQLWSYAQIRPNEQPDRHTVIGDIYVFAESGAAVAEIRGIRLHYLGRRANLSDDPDQWLYLHQWQPAPLAATAESTAEPQSWLIFVDEAGVGTGLQAQLAERGDTCILVKPGEDFAQPEPNEYQVNPSRPQDFEQLLQALPAEAKWQGVVHLWSLKAAPPEATTGAALQAAQQLGSESVLNLVQALANTDWQARPRLWLVTEVVQPVDAAEKQIAFAQAPLWGLGRVLVNEHPELRSVLIQLEGATPSEKAAALLAELQADEADDEVAWHGRQRFVNRLIRFPDSIHPEPLQPKVVPAQEHAYYLETGTTGVLDTLHFREVSRRSPPPGHVEIQVHTVGLNFRDVMLALGMVPPLAEPADMGWECAGIVTAVGDGVAELQIGDEVMAVTFYTFSGFAIANQHLVFPKPANLSLSEAATLPIVFMTAYYALNDLARLRQGERVLIHAAAGGVGLAAIQIAQWLGAEIFATAGNPEKRAFLRSLGIEHVMDSRSLDFAGEIMAQTNGKGVDVVLNSLAGEFIPKSLSVLAPYGRFLELGKADILQDNPLSLGLLRRNISFFVVDIVQTFIERPSVAGAIGHETFKHFADEIFRPLPQHAFAIADVEQAFRFMAQAKHIGKITLTLQNEQVPLLPLSPKPVAIDPNAAYLVTGGLGDLGLVVAQWLATNGARHLILMGRSGLPDRAQWAAVPPDSRQASQIERLQALEAQGVTVTPASVDVADEAQLTSFVQTYEGPPLRGVIHAAGVIEFKMLAETNGANLHDILRPKVLGSWFLHELFKETDLDFFVLFSSASTAISSPLLGSYAAANAFLDALAHYRQAQGLPILNINWGFWAEAGAIARIFAESGRNLAPRGMVSFTPSEALNIMEQLLYQEVPQAIVMPIDWQAWAQAYPMASRSSRLAHLITPQAEAAETPDNAQSVLHQLRHATIEEQQQILLNYHSEQVARVLQLSADRLDLHQPLIKLGLDSLMAVELKYRIEADLGVDVPVIGLLQNLNTAELSKQIKSKLVSSSSKEQEKAAELLEQIDDMSDADVDALLNAMLAEKDSER